MVAEKYIMDYILEKKISFTQIQFDLGIDLEQITKKKKELVADDFLTLCTYLGIAPEEIIEFVLKNAD